MKKVQKYGLWAAALVALIGGGMFVKHESDLSREAQAEMWVKQARERRAYLAAHPEIAGAQAAQAKPQGPTVSASEWPVPEQRLKQLIPIGTSRESVLSLIGRPTNRSGSSDGELWTYPGLFLDPVTNQIGTFRVFFRDGSVRQLHFN